MTEATVCLQDRLLENDRTLGTLMNGSHLMNQPAPSTPKTATGGDILRILFAILLPPVGVFLQVGLGWHFWINIVLTILGYIPGIVHAVWIIATR